LDLEASTIRRCRRREPSEDAMPGTDREIFVSDTFR